MQASHPRALKWADIQRDRAMDPAGVAAEHLERDENEALGAYILAHASGEPRAITKCCWGNGHEVW